MTKNPKSGQVHSTHKKQMCWNNTLSKWEHASFLLLTSCQPKIRTSIQHTQTANVLKQCTLKMRTCNFLLGSLLWPWAFLKDNWGLSTQPYSLICEHFIYLIIKYPQEFKTGSIQRHRPASFTAISGTSWLIFSSSLPGTSKCYHKNVYKGLKQDWNKGTDQPHSLQSPAPADYYSAALCLGPVAAELVGRGCRRCWPGREAAWDEGAVVSAHPRQSCWHHESEGGSLCESTLHAEPGIESKLRR